MFEEAYLDPSIPPTTINAQKLYINIFYIIKNILEWVIIFFIKIYSKNALFNKFPEEHAPERTEPLSVTIIYI